MQSAYIGMFLVLFVVIMRQRNEQKLLVQQFMKKRNQKGRNEMKDLAKHFLEKECILDTFNGNQYTGTVREVSDGGVLIERNGKQEIVNLDLVVRIREYPRNKKGKKTAIVLD